MPPNFPATAKSVAKHFQFGTENSARFCTGGSFIDELKAGLHESFQSALALDRPPNFPFIASTLNDFPKSRIENPARFYPGGVLSMNKSRAARIVSKCPCCPIVPGAAMSVPGAQAFHLGAVNSARFRGRGRFGSNKKKRWAV